MLIKELRGVLDGLTAEYDDYSLCNGEIGMLDEQHQYRVDKPITAVYIDKDTKEIIFLHEQINEDSDDDSDPILELINSREFIDNFGVKLDKKAQETGGPIQCFVEGGWLHVQYHDGSTEPLQPLPA